jgi:hypothetical protein
MSSHFDAVAFESEGLPNGWNTVWGYLAKREPETLYFMDQPGADAVEFQDIGMVVCLDGGIEPMTVRSPAAVIDSGGPATIQAFPTLVLRVVFPSRSA